MTVIVAALYVAAGGNYYGLDGVEPWGMPDRDARDYQGPHPVVAHPPCNRWSMPFAKINETRFGHRVGGDGGCFAAALWAVRTFGGVLEHPAYTAAWAAYGLVQPQRGGWMRDGDGWVCQVAQSAYGHKARKRTWLYMHGGFPPSLLWGEPKATASCGGTKSPAGLPSVSKSEAKGTPAPFRDLLIGIARATLA